VKFIECQQGTPEWFASRVGKITASCFADAISTCSRKSGARDVGDPTAVAERYAADLAIERISGQPHGEPPKAWVLERGHEMETHARRFYEGRTGSYVTEAGICLTDDEIFGYSTDGLVDDDGLIEIKAPIDSTKILAMWATGDTSEYDHQMQGGMWITGRKWCDFIMYVPDLASIGKDLYVKRVFRDDAFIDAMVEGLARFDRMVGGFVDVLRGPMGDEALDDPDFQEVPPALAELGVATVTSIEAARPAPTMVPLLPSMRLGQINERLAPIALTADGLARLGFAPAATDKSAKLYHEADFPAMCAALIRHVDGVAQQARAA
jgi:exodeoxyribonuclease (lambda-induced)